MEVQCSGFVRGEMGGLTPAEADGHSTCIAEVAPMLPRCMAQRMALLSRQHALGRLSSKRAEWVTGLGHGATGKLWR